MKPSPPTTLELLRHLRSEVEPFRVSRAQGPRVKDAALHAAACQQSPERYALAALADGVQPSQQARVLFQLLAASRVKVEPPTRETLDHAVETLLTRLPPEQVLSVFLALRRACANHKHTRRAMLRYLLNCSRLEELAVRRRPALVDCLEHALGRDVARGCARLLGQEGAADPYVRRNLLRFADDPGRAAVVVIYLYGSGACPTPPRVVEPVPPPPVKVVERQPERPRTITATNRGDIAATLVHMYQGGTNPELKMALDRYVEEAAARAPRFDGSVALVLDASASTLGYGERQFCCVSQSHAFRLVLERCCPRLTVHAVGGAGELPRPEGDTDLATALLDALEGDPDVVAIVSDGYENLQGGDLARVAASLPAAGVTTPVIFVHSKFTDKDDLALRRPAPRLPELEFWHQDDFPNVLWSLFAASRPPHGEAFLARQLRQRQTKEGGHGA
jgi:hypothetical protein